MSSSRRRGPAEDVDKEKINGTTDVRKEQTQLKRKQNEVALKQQKWILIWILLILAVILLTYYYYYIYQPSAHINTKDSQDTTTTKKPTDDREHKSTKKSKTKKPVKPVKPGGVDKGNKHSTKANNKVKGEKNSPSKQAQHPSPAKSPSTGSGKKSRDPNKPIQIKKSDIPILRRPVPPSDPDRPLIIEILSADNALREGKFSDALGKFNEILKRFKQSPRGLLGKALALDGLSKQKNDMKILDNAIDLYYNIGFESFLASDDIKVSALVQLVDCSERRQKPNMLIKALKKALEIDPNHEVCGIKLGLVYMKNNEIEKAKKVLQNVISKWPKNSLAQANLGYILFEEKNYRAALPLLLNGLMENEAVRNNGRFYLYAGEAMTKLNRSKEAMELYGEAVTRGLFPSIKQRSLYNEPNLRAKPWWVTMDTREPHLQILEQQYEVIRSEVLSIIDVEAGVFTIEKKDKGTLTLYSNGRKYKENCQLVPKSCELLATMTSVTKCKRGETRFLLLPNSLHLSSHVGLTNTKLRALLPLKLSGTLKMRVDEETRELNEGNLVVFDDSFEQELWYAGSGSGLVLVIEFWHPDLSKTKRAQLSSL